MVVMVGPSFGSSTGAADVASKIAKAAEALATDPASALKAARRVLTMSPNDPRALLILGSAYRRLGDAKAALDILAPLVKAFPRAAHTQYEVGAALADLDRGGEALIHLRAATALNRDLAEAWRTIGHLLFKTGDAVGAEHAYAEHERASVREPRLKPAAEAMFAKDLAGAEEFLRAYLLAAPDHVEGLRLLGDVYLRQGRHSDAEILFRRCVEIDPGGEGPRFSLATSLFHQQRAVEALTVLAPLSQGSPKNFAYRNLTAACLGLIGALDEALTLYEALLREAPKQPTLWLNYGHALKSIGRSDDAVRAFRRCIHLSPALGEAYWSLASLKVLRFTKEDEDGLNAALLRSDLSADNRLHLHFARGKVLEDQGDYAGALQDYTRGAALRRSSAPYDAAAHHQLVEEIKATLTPRFFDAREGVGHPEPAPIFIVGLPRSGSTLLEQILASHSLIEGTMELPDIRLIVRAINDRGPPGAFGYPSRLLDLSPGDFADLGRRYLETTRIHRRLGRPFFIDKMPNNFLHVGLIRLILPQAKIIDARRHPLGACLSAYKQHFAQGQNFSYSLEDLGKYYRDYVDIMRHFDTALPGFVHRVIYEDVVNNFEDEVEKILSYCGVPFEPGCLEFHTNPRPVRTVSAEQVRRPIFRDGLEQWRKFEPWLDPLKDALGPTLETWRR